MTPKMASNGLKHAPFWHLVPVYLLAQVELSGTLHGRVDGVYDRRWWRDGDGFCVPDKIDRFLRSGDDEPQDEPVGGRPLVLRAQTPRYGVYMMSPANAQDYKPQRYGDGTFSGLKRDEKGYKRCCKR